jgi:hypothetical protein
MDHSRTARTDHSTGTAPLVDTAPNDENQSSALNFEVDFLMGNANAQVAIVDQCAGV